MKEPMTDQQILEMNAEALGFVRRWVFDRDIDQAKANICSAIQSMAASYGVEHGFTETMHMLSQATQCVVRDFATGGVPEAIYLMESYVDALDERSE